MSDTSDLVCAKCGSDRIYVDFTARGYGKAEIAVDNKGKPYVDHIYDRDFDHDEEHEQFTCGKCEATWYPLEKGLRPRYAAGVDFTAGDLVVLPDGFKATVETVDPQAGTFTVVGWHEVFKAGEAAPLPPMAVAA